MDNFGEEGKPSSPLTSYSDMSKTGNYKLYGAIFCRSSGNVMDEVIKAYIEGQSHETDENFRIEGEISPDKPTTLT
jgi:hypothetical protein